MPKRVMLLGRSGGDLRWSYCEGDANDANDAHNLAPCDVRRVRDAFKALEYDEIVVLKATADEGEIVNRLNAKYKADGGAASKGAAVPINR